MSITLTSAQAAALAGAAVEHPSPLQLHQIGEDPEIFITLAGEKKPTLRILADGTLEAL